VNKKEIVTTVATVGLLAFVARGAFSPDVRQRMYARDNGECQRCGKRFGDGWLLDCSHYDHDKNKSNYNNINNGRILCLACHLEADKDDPRAAYLIRKRIEESHGGRTRDWIARNIRR